MTKIFPFTFYNQSDIRTILIKGEPWFIAADLCRVLDIANTSQAVSRLDEDERGICTVYTPQVDDVRGMNIVHTPSGDQEMLIVNESGLYSLIFTSRKPEAKVFRKWVTQEVLPSIRRTGSYQLNRSVITDRLKAYPKIHALIADLRSEADPAVWNTMYELLDRMCLDVAIDTPPIASLKNDKQEQLAEG